MFSSSISQAPSGVMKEQILQARLGNVHIAKVGAGGSCQARDLRDERSAAIRINVRASAVIGADLADSRKRLQRVHQTRRLASKTQAQQITTGNRRFELLRRVKRDH